MSGNTEKCDDADWKTPRPSCTCGVGDVWGLRLTKHAQPEIRHALQLAHDAIAASTPEPLPAGAWHMPLIRPADVLECSSMVDAMLIRLTPNDG
jgi:hypothetical protein